MFVSTAVGWPKVIAVDALSYSISMSLRQRDDSTVEPNMAQELVSSVDPALVATGHMSIIY